MVLGPFDQLLSRVLYQQSVLHHPYLSACLESHLHVHGAHSHHYSASNVHLDERARRDLRDCG